MDRANVSFVKNNFKDCPLLEKLTVGACDVVFATGTNENTSASIFTNCPNLTVIDITKANATFNKYSFASDQTIKHLLMGEGNTYVFREDAFRHSVLEEVIIPDNSNVTLDKKCFAETFTIKYIYVGSYSIASGCIGSSTNTSIFGGNSYLSTLVLMEGIDTLEQWVISTKDPGAKYGPLCDLTVYVHSDNFRINNDKTNSAFNGRKGDYKVILYVADPDFTIASTTTSFNFVLYSGIGHAFEQNVITPSNCTVQGTFGWAAKGCDCGIDYRGIAYKSISNKDTSLNNVTHEPYSTDVTYLELDPTVHTIGDVLVDIVYEDYFANGVKYYLCAWCNDAHVAEEKASAEPLFTAVGYSAEEESTTLYSVSHTIIVNKEAMNEFIAINDGDVEYGMIGGVYSANPLNENGEAGFSVVKINMTGTDYSKISVKINGLDENNLDFGFAMCAYVIDGTESTIKYICGNVTSTEAVSVSYNSIAKKDEE